jgi:serine protease
MILAKAFSGSAALAWMPFSFLSIPWLLISALILLLLARAALRAQTAKGK